MIDTLIYYLSFPFVIYAIIVGVLIALCSSLLGATLVLKRMSYIGCGLSNIAFLAIAIATVLKLTNQEIIVFPVTAICAVLLLRIGQNAKINGDAAIAMLSAGSLAIGYLLMNIFPSSANFAGDVCTTLFGSTSILTLRPTDVWISTFLSIFVAGVFLIFYNKIFAVTFDENFAKATGVNASRYNTLIAVTTSAVVVVALNLVGSLLTSALIVFPALSSMRLFNNFKAVVISSVAISVFCAFTGIITSILYGTPVGATIVAMDVVIFGISYCISLKGRRSL